MTTFTRRMLPFFGFDCFLVLALDPEYEIVRSSDHFVVGLFVFIELFQVCYLVPDLAAKNSRQEVDCVWYDDEDNAPLTN